MNLLFRGFIIAFAMAALALLAGRPALAQAPAFQVYPAPAGAPTSAQFTVQIQQGGTTGNSPVYETQNPTPAPTPPKPPMPPFESTTAWTSFATDVPVTVQVTNTQPFQSVRILPSHAGITATPILQGANGYLGVTFTLGGLGGGTPQQVSVEFCYTPPPPNTPATCTEDTQVLSDIAHPLLVFANPLSANVAPPGTASQTLYAQPGATVPPLTGGQTTVSFGPGLYTLGDTPYALGPGQTAYLAGGAYVMGMFAIGDSTTITGLGVLSGKGVCKTTPASGCSVMIGPPDKGQKVSNVILRGITLVDSPFYNILLAGLGNTVFNIKVMSWLPNTDGISAGSGGLLDSFFKTGDDAIKLYASNLTVSGCTLWHLGNAAPFELGVNLKEDVSGVTVQNSDVIRTEWVYPNRSNAVFSAAFGGNATGSAYSFSNIRIENTNTTGFAKSGVKPMFQLFKLAVIPNAYTAAGNDGLGALSGVAFTNIQASDPTTLPNLFQSFDRAHRVQGVSFDTVTVAGQTLQTPTSTFNANRTFSLSGTVFSSILWRSTTDPARYQASVFNGAADGASLPPVALGRAPPSLAPRAIGDVDGNGYASVMMQSGGSSSLSTLALWDQPMTGSSFFLVGTDYLGNRIVGAGDVNGDGRTDAVLWNGTAQAGAILLMDGAWVGGVYPLVPGPKSTWSVAGVGDIDQDGHADVVLRDQNANVDVLSYGSGPTPTDYPMAASMFNYTTADHVTHPIDATWQAAGVGDVRGGGYASIVWVQPSTGQVAITAFAFEAPPQGPYTTPIATLPTGYEVASTGDFNGDGTMDLLLVNATTGRQIVWYMGYFGPDILYKQGAPLPAQPGWAVQP